jgi:quercetin dioxygenase-like cupin family protein
MTEALLVAPGAGTTIEGPAGGPVTFKARGTETGGGVTALESVVAPGDGPPLHAHANEDEVLYVLEGDVRFRLGEEVRPGPAGTFVFVPRGLPHCFQNTGDGHARLLVLFTPAGMERFFERFAEVPQAALGPQAFAQAGAPVGMEVLGPPLR